MLFERKGSLPPGHERSSLEQEAELVLETFQPAAALYLAGTGEGTVLSKGIEGDARLQEQAHERRMLHGKLDSLFAAIPNVTQDVHEAQEEGKVTAEQLEGTYQQLASFLMADPEHARLILYLPFELLPHGDCAGAEADFKAAYLEGWRRLIKEGDLRANFADGDIVETEFSGERPEEVRKAVHLTPYLVEKGIVTLEEVTSCVEGMDDSVAKGMLDVFPVLADRHLLPRDTWRELFLSENANAMQAAVHAAHGLEGEGFDDTEAGKLFDLFHHDSYRNVTAREMYTTFRELLPFAGQLLQGDMLGSHDQQKLTDMVIAATRFWSTAPAAGEVVSGVAEVSGALSSKEDFEGQANSPEVEEWLRLWNVKYLYELGEDGGKDGLESSEVMSSEQAWQRLDSAGRLHELQDKGKESEQGSAQIIFARLDEALQKSEQRYVADSQGALRDNPGRLAWERIKRCDGLHTSSANALFELVRSGVETPVSLWQSGAQHPVPALRALDIYIQEVGKYDRQLAEKEANECLQSIKESKLEDSLGVRDELATVISHWAVTGLVPPEALEDFEITIPHLDAPPSLEPTPNIMEELKGLGSLTTELKENPALAGKLYPLYLAFGSRFKGYANKGADVDVALMVKPDVRWEEQGDLHGALDDAFAGKEHIGKMVEFWLEEDGENLKIRNVSSEDNSVADDRWAHLLFGGVWHGDAELVKETASKLLETYLHPTSGSDRTRWLREMEREVLQYRLMHKGYRRFYPERGTKKTAHGEQLDQESAFWDSGYRRVATKLFISRVFLPDLSK
ncbi:MAG TPA: hypothetical protein VLA04_06720 [Verrucomicrobiae bacterium]|nr:hypothetical protein [Verrucomicrobiae bacterium]